MSLESENLLKKPATTLRGGQVLRLVFSKGIGPFDRDRLVAWFDGSADMYGLTDGTEQGNAVGISVKLRAQPVNKTVDRIFSGFGHVVPRFGDAILSLDYVLPDSSGKVADIVALLIKDNKYSSDTGLFGLGIGSFFESLKKTIGQAAFYVIVVLVLILAIYIASKWKGKQ